MGKMNKFYEENCLLQQEFVHSDIFQVPWRSTWPTPPRSWAAP